MCRQLEYRDKREHFYFLILTQEKNLDPSILNVCSPTLNLPQGYVYLETVLPLNQSLIRLLNTGGILLCMLPRDFPRPKLSQYKPVLEAILKES